MIRGRGLRRGLRRARGGLLIRAAALHRRRLRRIVRVGITGSCGKTTTKELVAAVLATRGPGTCNPGTFNDPVTTARTLLATSPRDAFCAVELAATGPGTLAPSIGLLRPEIGVVTTVGADHYTAFRGPDAVAVEKGRLVEALPSSGTAVLNADDPRVLAMAARCRGHVLTYGTAHGADVRAEDVSAAWPDRLSFTVVHAGRSTAVRTRLAGAQLLPCVLAAIAAGRAAGIALEDAARAVGSAEPQPLRMQPLEAPGGVTFIRDELKAPLWSLPAVFEFLHAARARRKIVVFGTLSDYSGKAGVRYPQVAKQALAVADRVVFVGPNAERAAKARPEGSDALVTFATLREAADFLERELRPGDLVVLKGSDRADHLGRLALRHVREVACWRERCGRARLCDHCNVLAVPSDRAARFGPRTDGIRGLGFHGRPGGAA